MTNASTGTIVTSGALSYGVFAQSVGGGGGAAGSSSATSSGGGDANVSIELGGKGGSGQNGGAVTVTLDGTIATSGVNANAIMAQSVGGGGGIGGSRHVERVRRQSLCVTRSGRQAAAQAGAGGTVNVRL